MIDDALVAAEAELRASLSVRKGTPVEMAVARLQLALLRPFRGWVEDTGQHLKPKELCLATTNGLAVLLVNLIAMFEDECQDDVREEIKKMLCEGVDHYFAKEATTTVIVIPPVSGTH